MGEGFIPCNKTELMRAFHSRQFITHQNNFSQYQSLTFYNFCLDITKTLPLPGFLMLFLHCLVPAQTATGAGTDLHTWLFPLWLTAGVQEMFLTNVLIRPSVQFCRVYFYQLFMNSEQTLIWLPFNFLIRRACVNF